jgi:hypothetical protein
MALKGSNFDLPSSFLSLECFGTRTSFCMDYATHGGLADRTLHSINYAKKDNVPKSAPHCVGIETNAAPLSFTTSADKKL